MARRAIRWAVAQARVEKNVDGERGRANFASPTTTQKKIITSKISTQEMKIANLAVYATAKSEEKIVVGLPSAKLVDMDRQTTKHRKAGSAWLETRRDEARQTTTTMTMAFAVTHLATIKTLTRSGKSPLGNGRASVLEIVNKRKDSRLSRGSKYAQWKRRRLVMQARFSHPRSHGE